MKRSIFIVMPALVGITVLFYSLHLFAAGTGFPIYFEDSALVVEAQTVNRTTYLPLMEIVERLRLPYTDSVTLETFTIRTASNARLVVSKNSGLISVNDQIMLLRSPVLRENNQWLVPVDFLIQGLSRVSGVPFRYRPGASRVFAGNVSPSELVMNAQGLGPVTRLTLRSAAPIKITVSREENRAVLKISPSPMDPLRERLDIRDRLVRSIAFDDADGQPKIVVETSDLVSDIRVNAAEEDHVYFIDFARKAEITESIPVPAAVPAASSASAARPDPGTNRRGIRVIVIDPGHGGADTGAENGGTLEKDLTLTIARKLRSSLQNRLGTTVLLTRDSDVALTNEARSAVANNNQADFFLSLHIGYSANKLESGSSVYVMKEDFAVRLSPTASRDRLFLPWYLGYRSASQSSRQIAQIVQEELSKALPGWKFPLRNGPIAVFASATMPSVALEIGNLNNTVSTQTLLDDSFQTRLAATIASAIERFVAGTQTPAAY